MYQALNPSVVPRDAGIDFGLKINTAVQHFRISLEALRDHCGADAAETPAELLECFARNEQEICAKAFVKSPVPPDDSLVVLMSRDF